MNGGSISIQLRVQGDAENGVQQPSLLCFRLEQLLQRKASSSAPFEVAPSLVWSPLNFGFFSSLPACNSACSCASNCKDPSPPTTHKSREIRRFFCALTHLLGVPECSKGIVESHGAPSTRALYDGRRHTTFCSGTAINQSLPPRRNFFFPPRIVRADVGLLPRDQALSPVILAGLAASYN